MRTTRTAFMGAFFFPDQRARIEAAAEAMGTSYSELLRRGALALADLALTVADGPGRPDGGSVEPVDSGALR